LAAQKRWDFKVIVPRRVDRLWTSTRIEAAGSRLPFAHPARLWRLGELGRRLRHRDWLHGLRRLLLHDTRLDVASVLLMPLWLVSRLGVAR
jgi:hypothetical protein